MKRYQWILLYLGIVISAAIVVLAFLDIILLNTGLPTIIYRKDLMAI